MSAAPVIAVEVSAARVYSERYQLLEIAIERVCQLMQRLQLRGCVSCCRDCSERMCQLLRD